MCLFDGRLLFEKDKTVNIPEGSPRLGGLGKPKIRYFSFVYADNRKNPHKNDRVNTNKDDVGR